MRKTLLSIATSLLIVGVASAQEDQRELGTTNKIGQNILPAKGDIAIGIDAAPFLGYIGNIFTDAYNDAPEFNGPNSFFGGNTLYGKYFLTDKSAIRARVSFDFNSQNRTESVRDDAAFAADPTSDAEVKDKWTTKENYFEFGAGYELRRGYGRLQGYYGGELTVGFANSSDKYTYGNAITSTNTNPTSAFGGTPRTTAEKNGNAFFFGIGGFAGVEYFVAPKISLGGELGVSILTGNVKGGKTTTEFWNGTEVETETVDNSNDKFGGFGFGTRTNGRLMVTFHF